MSIEPCVYPPRESEEVERQLDEHYANLACRDGMEEIIRRGFDGARLDSGCAKRAIAEFGIQRVELVLADTVQSRFGDGRFSRQVREWAGARAISSKELGWGYILSAHSAVVDGFTRQYLRTVEEMAREAAAEGKQEQPFPEMTL